MAPDCTECRRLIGVINEKTSKVEELKNKITEYKKRSKEAIEQKEESRKKVEELEKKIQQLEQEIEELKKEVARIEALENTVKEHEKKLEEMRKREESNAAEIEELKKEMEECTEVSKWNDEENQKLKKESMKYRKNSKGNANVIQDQHKLYLGQICFELQNNLYRYVIPEHYCTGDWPYKINDIEKDIIDEDFLTDEERKEAEGKLKELKERINWNKLRKLIGTMRLLQEMRNEVAHPPVDESKAMYAAEELEKQGRLKGKTSFEKVKDIIDLWSKSKSLLLGD